MDFWQGEPGWLSRLRSAKKWFFGFLMAKMGANLVKLR